MKNVLKAAACPKRHRRWLPKACGDLVRNSRRLVALCGLRATDDLAARVLRSAPRAPVEAEATGPEAGFCVLCLLTAEDRPLTSEQFSDLLGLATYFLDEVPGMPPRRRAIAEAVALATLGEED